MVDGRAARYLQNYLFWYLERQQMRQLVERAQRTMPDLPDEPWMDDGACTQAMNPDAWFPPRPNALPPETVLAIKVCLNRCPVRDQCLRYALAHHVHGVWGGTTEAQRAHLASQQEAL